MKVDFHLHTNCSDGLFQPTEVVDMAVDAGYNLISLTDHDCAGAYPALKDYPQRDAIRIIRGVELTANHQDKEIHILGYFQNGFSPEMDRFLTSAQDERNRRINTSIKNLQKYDINITYGDLLKFSRGESVGRNHLASLLVDKGYVSSVREAFDRYLNDDTAVVPPMMTTVPRAIELIHNSDGVAIWAHPPYDYFQGFLPEFVQWGLDGIEAYNQKRTLANARQYQATAEKMGLLVSAGSDWHGFDGETLLTNYVPDALAKFINLF